MHRDGEQAVLGMRFGVSTWNAERRKTEDAPEALPQLVMEEELTAEGPRRASGIGGKTGIPCWEAGGGKGSTEWGQSLPRGQEVFSISRL